MALDVAFQLFHARGSLKESSSTLTPQVSSRQSEYHTLFLTTSSYHAVLAPGRENLYISKPYTIYTVPDYTSIRKRVRSTATAIRYRRRRGRPTAPMTAPRRPTAAHRVITTAAERRVPRPVTGPAGGGGRVGRGG